MPTIYGDGKMDRIPSIFLGFIMALPLSGNAAHLTLVEGPLGTGRMYLPCIFSSQTDSCFLDTGMASTSMIKNDHFSQQFPSIGKEKVAGAAGIAMECDVIQVPSFWVAERSSGARSFLRCPEGGESESTVGLDVIKPYIVKFDFDRKSFELLDKIPNRLRTSRLNVYAHGLFGFEVTISGADIQTVFDTGAAMTAIDQKLVDMQPDGFKFIQDIAGSDVAGKPVMLKLYVASNLSILGKELSDVNVVGMDFSVISNHIDPNVSMIVGYNIISKMNWYFDLPGRRWAPY